MGTAPRSIRAVRLGGALWVIGVIIFLAATTAEALLLLGQGYSYSFLTNTISNLGDPSLFPFPYYLMLNVSAVIFGAMVLGGLPAFYALRPGGNLGRAAALFLILSGVGTIGVGIFNEHLDYTVHISMAGLAFVSNGLVPRPETESRVC